MSTRLAVLGFLANGPEHGYNINKMIEKMMGDWIATSVGSIYFALNKLTDEGFIAPAGEHKEGGRPTRRLYRITDRGREEYLRLLRETWTTPQRQYYDLDLAVFFLDSLNADEVAAYLRERIAALEHAFDSLAEHRAEETAASSVPDRAAIIFDHSLSHLRTELAWTCDLLVQLEGGEPT